MILPELSHPFCRYGLAIALESDRLRGREIKDIEESDLRLALAESIEDGLTRFRLQPKDIVVKNSDPKASDRPFDFVYISHGELQCKSNLVQSPGLSKDGKYLCPTILCADGGAKATFEQSERIAAELRKPANSLLNKPQELKRSFVPVAGEINNGKRNKENPRGTLLEAACGAVATLTPVKPSRMVKKQKGDKVRISNIALFPDLPLLELRRFIRVFDRLRRHDKGLLIGKIIADGSLRRPGIFRGNYPFAVSAETLGAAGLLAAIGYWAKEASEYDREEARKTLEALEECPIYILGYDDCDQARFNHHVVALAWSGTLYTALQAFLKKVRLYSRYEYAKVPYDDPEQAHLLRGFNLWLQFFDQAHFQNFLANRAEYPAEITPILETYFMQINKIDATIVDSALALGKWINRTAYIVSKEQIPLEKRKVKKLSKDEWKQVDKDKAKILVEFESAVFSAKDAADLLNRISVRTGRLSYQDIPHEAEAFYRAAATGDGLELKQAQHLIVAFMRIAPPRREVTEESDNPGEPAADGGGPEVDADDSE